MGSFFADLMSGGVEGLAKGAGQFAKDIRTAITGKEPLGAEQQAMIIARADALEAAAMAMESQAAQGQIDLNKIDAQSGSMFKGGWRPAIGWVCVAGLSYTFIVRPILPWTVTLFGVSVDAMPILEMKELMALVMALLGFGGFRMYEKIKSVS
jgi:hypothetical protein